jgi:hydrogenase assembly chaperone HypC/HupF
MCLGIVGQVVSVDDARPDLALVDVAGAERTINIGILDGEDIAAGDWILIHAGFAMEKIDAETAWDTVTDSSALVVFVIDTGVETTHDDIVNNLWSNPGEIPGDGIDNEGNGFVDDVHGYDFVNHDVFVDRLKFFRLVLWRIQGVFHSALRLD